MAVRRAVEYGGGAGAGQERSGGCEAANQPEIRFFNVGENKAYRHREQAPEGSWKVVTPETASRVSAVGYYFARRVREDVYVPIGLLQDNAGGTPAEGWTSAEALHALGDFEIPLALVKHMAEIGAPETGANGRVVPGQRPGVEGQLGGGGTPVNLCAATNVVAAQAREALRFPLKSGERRSDRGSSPCSTLPRSHGRTAPLRPRIHRLPPARGVGSLNRRRDPRGCRSI